jgi:hypothetical protein
MNTTTAMIRRCQGEKRPSNTERGYATVVLPFGSEKVPELARSRGGSMKELRRGTGDGADDDHEDV